MITEKNIHDFLTEKLLETGIFIVEVAVKPGNRIYVYIDSMNNVTIDDCSRITRMINDSFDREVEDYALEVSSAGLTSAFKVEQQYVKHLGKSIKVKTKDGTLIKGVLNSYKDKNLFITATTKVKGKTTVSEHSLSLDDITETKLDIVFF